MGSPVQVQLDLKDVFKALSEFVSDIRHAPEDMRAMALELQSQFGYSETLVNATNRRFQDLSSPDLGYIQLGASQERVYSLYRSWGEFQELWRRGTGEESLNHASPSSPLALRRQGTYRRIWWTFSGKSRANRILDDVRNHNDHLLFCYKVLFPALDISNPRVSVSLAQDPSDIRRALPYPQINRLEIQRGRIEVDRNIFRSSDWLDSSKRSQLGTGSFLQTAAYTDGGDPRNVLLELYPVNDFSQDTERKVLELAMRLSQPRVDGFQLLRCLFVVPNMRESRYEFAFDLSDLVSELQRGKIQCKTDDVTASFYSLSSQFSRSSGSGNKVFVYSEMEGVTFKPLSILQRLTFARSLAGTVSELHLAQWVHGNITSRNIWFYQSLFQDDDAAASTIRMGKPYLLGFRLTKMVGQYSDEWGRQTQVTEKDNVYRHPERQIIRDRKPLVPHGLIHDIYSLGVIFLEIGLGKSAAHLLRVWGSVQRRRQMRGPSEGAAAVVPPATQNGLPGLDAELMRLSCDAFLQLAELLLPEKMGDTYAEITRRCLAGDITSLGDDDQRDIVLSIGFRSRVVDILDGLISANTSP